MIFFPPEISELCLLLIKADTWQNKSAGKSLHRRPCAAEDKVVCTWINSLDFFFFFKAQAELHKAFFRVLLAEKDDFNQILYEWRIWPSMEKCRK